MKKFLYATTALASVGMIAGAASDAAAAERIRLGLSGYHQQWGVYSNQDIDTPTLTGSTASRKIKTVPFDQKHNSEICVIGETTLDNGLTIGVNVQIEANTSGDSIDESYLYVQHPTYGQLILGDENNAGYLLHVTAPDGGINWDSGDMINNDFWVNTSGQSYFNTALGTTNLRFNDNDSGKFTYITPRFFGFQAGYSFIPQLEPFGGDCNSSVYYTNLGSTFGASGGNNCGTNQFKNGSAGGLNYREKFGDFGVQASVGAMYAFSGRTGRTLGNQAPSGSELFAWNLGAQFSYAGFEFGGAYNDAPNRQVAVSGNNSMQSHSWTVGAAYEWGPYRVGLGYMKGETRGNLSVNKWTRLDQANISGTYTLGPGIRLVGGFFLYDIDAQDQDRGFGNNNNGWGFASGLKLGF
jgi:outer membrane protein OmpU